MKLNKFFSLLILLLIFLIHNNSFSLTKMYRQSSESDYNEKKYETVHIICDDNLCWLYCNQEGLSYGCNFQEATWCSGCIEDYWFFDKGQGQDMFDHVANQLSNNVNSGSYSNTLVFERTNEIMTRSISWEVNDCTGMVDIQLIMTEIQLPND